MADRWIVLALIFVVRIGLGFQFQSAGSVAPFLVDELGIDYGQVGTLVGLYMVAGLVLAVPGGFIGKRFGDKRVLLAGMTLMVVGGVVSGAAESYPVVALGRLISGSGSALLFVLMTKIVTDWFAGKELFVGMSVFLIGWPVGIAAGQAVQGVLAEQASWNAVFHLSAALVAVGLVAFAWLYRAPPAPARRGPPAAGNMPWRGGLSGVELWLVCLVGCMWMLLNGAYLVVLSFGPTLLIEHGATIAESGLVVSLLSWVCLIILPLVAWITARYRVPDAAIVIGVLATVIAGLLIPYTSAPLATFTLYGIGIGIAAPIMASLQAEVLRPENRGPGLGIYYVWFFAGNTLLPAGAGFLRDMTGSAAASMLFGAALMAGCLVLLALLRLEQRRLAATLAAQGIGVADPAGGSHL